jgi:hypothetical protein
VGATEKRLLAVAGSLKRMKALCFVGGTLTATSGFGLATFEKSREQARQLQSEVAKFTTLSLGDAVDRDGPNWNQDI